MRITIPRNLHNFNQVRRSLRRVELRDRPMAFDAYDLNGGQNLAVTSTVSLSTVKTNTNTTVFSWDSSLSELTVKGKDDYRVDARLTIQSDADSLVEFWFEVDRGSGFVEEPGTRSAINLTI